MRVRLRITRTHTRTHIHHSTLHPSVVRSLWWRASVTTFTPALLTLYLVADESEREREREREGE